MIGFSGYTVKLTAKTPRRQEAENAIQFKHQGLLWFFFVVCLLNSLGELGVLAVN